MTPSQHLALAASAALHALRLSRQPRQWSMPSVAEIQPSRGRLLRIMARAHLVPLAEMRSASRRQAVVRARWEFYWRAAATTDMSYVAIGRSCYRDHSTVCHGIARHCMRTGLPLPRAGADLVKQAEQRMDRNNGWWKRRRLADRMTQEDHP